MLSAMVVRIVASTIFILASSVTSYPVGPWSSGAHASYYGPHNGKDRTMGSACGYGGLLGEFYGTHTTALSGALFQKGQHCGALFQKEQRCGACFELRCQAPLGWCIPGTSVVVTATNLCPVGSWGGWCDAPHEHFDMSVPAFTTITNKDAGPLVSVQYRRVPCQKEGGIRFLIKGYYSFLTVLIYNVGGAGDIKSVAIKGEHTKWFSMKRNWGENWQLNRSFVGQALSFSVTTSDGATVVSQKVANSNWEYGMTFEGSNFQ